MATTLCLVALMLLLVIVLVALRERKEWQRWRKDCKERGALEFIVERASLFWFVGVPVSGQLYAREPSEEECTRLTLVTPIRAVEICYRLMGTEKAEELANFLSQLPLFSQGGEEYGD